MAELADALDLGSSAERRAGSSPVPGTIKARPLAALGISVADSLRPACGTRSRPLVTSSSSPVPAPDVPQHTG